MTGQKRRPGRPDIGGRVAVSLGVERLARLDEARKITGVSRAEMIRRIIDVALGPRHTT